MNFAQSSWYSRCNLLCHWVLATLSTSLVPCWIAWSLTDAKVTQCMAGLSLFSTMPSVLCTGRCRLCRLAATGSDLCRAQAELDFHITGWNLKKAHCDHEDAVSSGCFLVSIPWIQALTFSLCRKMCWAVNVLFQNPTASSSLSLSTCHSCLCCCSTGRHFQVWVLLMCSHAVAFAL